MHYGLHQLWLTLIAVELLLLSYRLKSDKLYCDATFKVLGEKFCVHRCILASRCSTLLDKVEKRLENKKTIIVKDLIAIFLNLAANENVFLPKTSKISINISK